MSKPIPKKEQSVNKKPAGKRSPEVWLNAALEILAHEGIDRVMVEPMARKLGVTKGSFYWHFKNRDDLLQQMLEYWSGEMTSMVFGKIAHLDTGPQAKMFALMEEISLKSRGRFDPAIRSWSKKDPAVARVVREIDSQRLEFLFNLLREGGFDDIEATTRAQLLYGYMVGESSILHKSNKVEQLEGLTRMIEIIFSRVQPSE